jgi:transcriptional regulator with XRE-family HTH domain
MTKKLKFPQQDLAERLRRALDEARISQAALARACGVTDQAVHDWVISGRIAKEHFPTISALTGKGLEYFLVGLKTWRRVAAIALPILSLPLFEIASRACVLCKIRDPGFRIAKQPLSPSPTAT